MVRLKVGAVKVYKKWKHGFQFPYGAIKAMCGNIISGQVLGFQFCYCATKAPRSSGRRIFHFNSSMVRLKSPCRQLPLRLYLYFNSKMARL